MKNRLYRSIIGALVLCIIFCSLPGIQPGHAEPITVKSYQELLKAINVRNAEEIIISSKYRHGTKKAEALVIPEGKTVTLRSRKENVTAVIDGRVDVYGGGTLILERVDIAAEEGAIGLRVSGKSHVVACNVAGGSSKKGCGGTAIFADGGSEVEAAFVQGGNAAGLGMLAGDGVLAVNEETKVTVGRVIGGEANLGFGGAGVITQDSGRVIADQSFGGDGAIEEGKAFLTGYKGIPAEVTSAHDGFLLETKKKRSADEIATDGALMAALRRGQTTVQLSVRFKSAQEPAFDGCPLFLPASGEAEIIGPTGKKHAALRNSLTLLDGKLTLTGVDLIENTSTGYAAVIYGGSLKMTGDVRSTRGCGIYVSGANLDMEGDITSQAWVCLYATSGAQVTMKGNIRDSGSNYNAVRVLAGAKVRLTGSVEATTAARGSDGYLYAAVLCAGEGSELAMEGNIKAKNCPLTVRMQASAEVNGDLSSDNDKCLYADTGAKVTVVGNLTGAPAADYALYVSDAIARIMGNVSVTKAAAAEGKDLPGVYVTGKDGNYDQTGSLTAKGICLKAENEAKVRIAGNVATLTPDKYNSLEAYSGAGIEVEGAANGKTASDEESGIVITAQEAEQEAAQETKQEDEQGTEQQEPAQETEQETVEPTE